MNITVYCGSNLGVNPNFQQAGIDLGKWMVEKGHDLIYGGGDAGIMGVVANSVMDAGGRVDGYMLKDLMNEEFAKHDITNLYILDTMNERKDALINNADTFILLPGGIGSMEELFDTISWTRIQNKAHKLYVINIDGFYDPLEELLQNFDRDKMMPQYELDRIYFLKNVKELNKYF